MGDTKTILRAILAACAFAWIGGCSEEPPPPSVEAFMDDPILLDATMVRCVANRDSVNYDPECVNAREAVERLAAAEEEARRAALEAESERKREALRRAREAADEARARAEALAEEREQAEYLGLLPASPATGAAAAGEGVAVTAGDMPEASAAGQAEAAPLPAGGGGTPPAATDAGAGAMPESAGSADARSPADAGSAEAPPPEAAAGTPPVTTDLGEIRKALEERAPAAPPTGDAADPPG